MKISKVDIIKYLLELLIVAFGVMLGLYVSELRTDQLKNAKKEKTLVYIKEEIRSNIDLLQHAITYHDTIKKNLRIRISSLDREDLSLGYFSSKKIPSYSDKRLARTGSPGL